MQRFGHYEDKIIQASKVTVVFFKQIFEEKKTLVLNHFEQVLSKIYLVILYVVFGLILLSTFGPLIVLITVTTIALYVPMLIYFYFVPKEITVTGSEPTKESVDHHVV